MSWRKVKLGELIENFSVKAKDFDIDVSSLDFFGVSNTDGITKSKYASKDKADNYKIMTKGCFAYNPYRINVGSIAMLKDDSIGLISPAYVVFKVKEKTIIPELLLKFLKSPEGLRQIKLHARGTVRQALRFADLCKITISLPSYEEQLEFYKSISDTENISDVLSNELTHQLNLVKKLRQAFLREAMQGKLTAGWRKQNPDIEPANKLLEKIKAEKEHLIKEKKIRKSKALPPITKEEIPFEIPENWVWTRLGDICNVEKGKIGIKKAIAGKYNLVVTGEERLSHNEFHYEGKAVIIPLVSSTGHGHASLKRIHYEEGRFAVGNILACVLPYVKNSINMKFLYYYLDTYKESFFVKKMKGAANVSLKISSIQETPIPLIPIEIQNKYEKLVMFCDQLEESIKNSQSQNKMLLQQVLREALEPENEKTKEKIKL